MVSAPPEARYRAESEARERRAPRAARVSAASDAVIAAACVFVDDGMPEGGSAQLLIDAVRALREARAE